jgi:hypothetical protein
MEAIQAVGFDMDYTLAEYIPETFDLLAYDGALEKLVNGMGYPRECSQFQCAVWAGDTGGRGRGRAGRRARGCTHSGLSALTAIGRDGDD